MAGNVQHIESALNYTWYRDTMAVTTTTTTGTFVFLPNKGSKFHGKPSWQGTRWAKGCRCEYILQIFEWKVNMLEMDSRENSWPTLVYLLNGGQFRQGWRTFSTYICRHCCDSCSSAIDWNEMFISSGSRTWMSAALAVVCPFVIHSGPRRDRTMFTFEFAIQGALLSATHLPNRNKVCLPAASLQMHSRWSHCTSVHQICNDLFRKRNWLRVC